AGSHRAARARASAPSCARDGRERTGRATARRACAHDAPAPRRAPVGRAADAARANLEHRGEGLDARLELLDGVLAGPLTQDGERVVDDLLGGRLLPVLHHLVDDLLDEAVAVNGVRLDRPDLGSGATGHYFAFTPYCERAFLRSPTPAASSVP